MTVYLVVCNFMCIFLCSPHAPNIEEHINNINISCLHKNSQVLTYFLIFWIRIVSHLLECRSERWDMFMPELLSLLQISLVFNFLEQYIKHFSYKSILINNFNYFFILAHEILCCICKWNKKVRDDVVNTVRNRYKHFWSDKMAEMFSLLWFCRIFPVLVSSQLTYLWWTR